jgi:hypothetical protein
LEAFHEPLVFPAAGQNVFSSLVSLPRLFAVDPEVCAAEDIYFPVSLENVGYLLVVEHKLYVNFFDVQPSQPKQEGFVFFLP